MPQSVLSQSAPSQSILSPPQAERARVMQPQDKDVWLTPLIVTALTLLASIAAIGAYFGVRAMMLESVQQNALLEVKQGASDVDEWLAMRMTQVQTMAGTRTLKSLQWALIKPYFQDERSRIADFATFTVGLPNGDFFSSHLGGKAPGKISDRAYFKKALAGQANISDPFLSRTLNIPTIAVAAPIWGKGDRPVGEVHGSVRVDRIVQVIQQLQYGNDSYAFALNSEGAVIVHPDPKLMTTVEQPTPSFLKSAQPNLAQLAQAMINREAGIKLMDVQGTQQYVAYMPLDQVPWSIALVIPQATLESKLTALNLLAVPFAIFPLLVAWIAARQLGLAQQVSRQRQQLKAQARSLKKINLQFQQQTQALQAALLEAQRSQTHLINNQRLLTWGQLLLDTTTALTLPIHQLQANLQRLLVQVHALLKHGPVLLTYDQNSLDRATAEALSSQTLAKREIPRALNALPLLLGDMTTQLDRVYERLVALNALTQPLPAPSPTAKHPLGENSSIDLHVAIEQILLLLEPQLGARLARPPIKIIRQYSTRVSMMAGNGPQFYQILLNLISNAIDAIDRQWQTPTLKSHPTLRIRTQFLTSGRVLIRIGDNGCGMSQNLQSQLFKPFISTKLEPHHIGLGLSICRDLIIDRWQGDLRCISTPGRGSDFLIELPLRISHPAQPGSQASIEPPRQAPFSDCA